MPSKKRIAVLTSGGDCPGLNAVIRAVTKKAIFEHGMEVIGVEDGYEGLIYNKFHKLEGLQVSGILTLGGTILGTSNTANPYRQAVKRGKEIEFQDVSKTAIANLKKMKIDCLICIGGDGTLSTANKLSRDGVPVVGIPKTIDNDIRHTEMTFGFSTAVEIVTEGIDRLHTTAQSHHRVMIMEVMGRRAGWIALYSGVAGGGDIILIPEIPYSMNWAVQKVKERNQSGKRFSIVVVAEGAIPKGGQMVVRKIVKESTDPVRLGGISFVLAAQIEKLTGIDARAVVMGHLQRGGSPNSFDRVLTTQLGTRAVDLIVKKEFGFMIGVKGNDFVNVPLDKVDQGPRLVPLNHPLIRSAKSIGTSFGDS